MVHASADETEEKAGGNADDAALHERRNGSDVATRFGWDALARGTEETGGADVVEGVRALRRAAPDVVADAEEALRALRWRLVCWP